MGPQISIYDESNNSIVSIWDIGTVKAQTPSEVLTINIWNNKGGTTTVSDLKDCYITVLDYNGDTAVDTVAKDKWVQVNIPSIDGDENVWTNIGGNVVKSIRGNAGVDEYSILGTENSGLMSESSENVCTAKFRIFAPPNSAPGQKLFKIRVNGYFT